MRCDRDARRHLIVGADLDPEVQRTAREQGRREPRLRTEFDGELTAVDRDGLCLLPQSGAAGGGRVDAKRDRHRSVDTAPRLQGQTTLEGQCTRHYLGCEGRGREKETQQGRQSFHGEPRLSRELVYEVWAPILAGECCAGPFRSCQVFVACAQPATAMCVAPAVDSQYAHAKGGIPVAGTPCRGPTSGTTPLSSRVAPAGIRPPPRDCRPRRRRCSCWGTRRGSSRAGRSCSRSPKTRR